MKLAKIVCALLFILALAPAKAKHIMSCKVKQKSNFEWTTYEKKMVMFITGSELNAETNSLKYSRSTIYALLYSDANDQEPTIIALGIYLSGDEEVGEEHLREANGPFQGEDAAGTRWQICVSEMCF